MIKSLLFALVRLWLNWIYASLSKAPEPAATFSRFLAIFLLVASGYSLTSLTYAQCFNSPMDVPVGALPNNIVVADFNRDGKLDMATSTAQHLKPSVSVLLGDGTGGFGPATTVDAGNAASSLAVADINGDGNIDLAVLLYIDNKVSILLGDGQGGFGPFTQFNTGAYPIAVTVGDFNNDAKSDLVIANFNGKSVSILLGDGSGSFSAPIDYMVGTNPVGRDINPISLTQADFNGDGKLDLATANLNGGSVSILLGNGTGGFSSKTDVTVHAPTYIIAGDFNKDNRADLAVTNNFSNVSVWLGDGQGNFNMQTDYPVGNATNWVATGDFNNDTNPDLVVINYNGANLSVLSGDGLGYFGAAVNFALGGNPASTYPTVVTVGDFNKDARSDLATIVNEKQDKVTLLMNCTEGNAAFTLLAPTYDCQTGAFRFNTSGGDGSPIEFYAVPGITGWTTNPDQYVDAETRTAADAQPITLKARQSGQEVTYVWDIRAVCPIGASAFSIAYVSTIRCQAITATERQLTFTPQYSGLNGQAVSFSVVNELMPTSDAGPYSLRVYTDNPIIILKAQQGNSTASYSYNWLAACASSARAGVETVNARLFVKVLGNPVEGKSVEVEIRGITGQAVQLNLTDLQGRVLHQQRLVQAGSVERVSVPVGAAKGILLLQVNTATEHQQVKLLKP